MPAQFSRPDFGAPLDVDALVAAIPERATVKGMFFHSALGQARKKGVILPGREKYVAFQDYTVREHVQVLAECARLIYPGDSPRQALRRLGRDAYRIFVESMVGRVLFSVAARRFESALHLTSKAYKVVGNVSSATIEDEQPNSPVVHLRGVWNFPDSYHVGVFEEAVDDYGKKCEVLIRRNAADDVELKLVMG
jgi:uncharacterized protein (TIGR02265 family)